MIKGKLENCKGDIMMQKNKSKVLILKLGSNCNLKCPHCHCAEMHFQLNEDIFKYIKENNIRRITFSGGEPLLYYETIKYIMERCGKEYAYKFVTNGTLITNEMVEFFNQYRTYICVSYDGEDGGRDKCDPKYKTIAKLRNNGLSVTVYESNMDFSKLTDDVATLQEKNGLKCWYKGQFFPNFAHQTSLSPNPDLTKEIAQKYIVQFGKQLEIECIAVKNGMAINQLPFLSGVLKRWFFKRDYDKGVRCCNSNIINMTLSGDFLLCPYNTIKVGSIYTGLDYFLIDSYKPERCKSCDLWDVCKNPCIMNITENECYIFKKIYKHFRKLVKKYNIHTQKLREEALEYGYSGG